MIGRSGLRVLVLLAVLPVFLLVGCGDSRPPVVIVQQAPLGTPATPVTTAAAAPVTDPLTGLLPGSGSDATPVVAGAEGQALDTKIRAWIATQPAFNGTVMVSRGGQVVLSQAYGWADVAGRLPMRPDAIWDYCSVSKQYGAAAVLKLQMLGRVKLDGTLGTYLTVPADKAGITLRQLLSHTSGLAEYDTYRTDPTREATLKVMLAAPLISTPGTTWKYNNVNYTLIAAVVDRMSGMRYEDFVRTYLWKPAGVTGATFLGEADLDVARVPKDLDGTGVQFRYGAAMPHWWRGAAGTMTTARNLLQWDIALRGNAVLDEASKAELYRVVSDGYALGWFIDEANGETLYSHDGAQFNISTMYVRGKDSGIVITIATSRSNDNLWTLATQLHGTLRGAQASKAYATPPRFQSVKQARERGQR